MKIFGKKNQIRFQLVNQVVDAPAKSTRSHQINLYML
jgi:hypothetical protein